MAEVCDINTDSGFFLVVKYKRIVDQPRQWRPLRWVPFKKAQQKLETTFAKLWKKGAYRPFNGLVTVMCPAFGKQLWQLAEGGTTNPFHNSAIMILAGGAKQTSSCREITGDTTKTPRIRSNRKLCAAEYDMFNHGPSYYIDNNFTMDVGSLKTPLRAGLEALRDAGVAVTSLHPMFGPDTNLLSGKHVLFVDVGVPTATEAVRRLFAATMAEQCDVDLDMHDRLISFVLGLSHALNLSFNTALAASGEALPLLSRISSSTFEAQLGVSSRVAQENPQLYFEIQALNDYGLGSLDALHASVTQLREHVHQRDQEAFVAMMERGRDYVTARPAARR